MNLQQEIEESAKRMEVVKESLQYPSYEEVRADVISAYKETAIGLGEEGSVEGAKSVLEKIEFLAHIAPDGGDFRQEIADDWVTIAIVIDYLLTKNQQDD